MLGRAQGMIERGWSLLIVDSRGRGGSEGQFTTFVRPRSGRPDSLDRLARKRGRRHPPAPGRVGPVDRRGDRDKGGRVFDKRISALVLEAPYADLADSLTVWLPQGATARQARRSDPVASQTPGGRLARPPTALRLPPRWPVPRSIVHGRPRDPDLGTGRQIARLAHSFKQPPRIVEVPEVRHTDVFDVGGVALTDQVTRFAEVASDVDHAS